jgi:hypothetical protein
MELTARTLLIWDLVFSLTSHFLPSHNLRHDVQKRLTEDFKTCLPSALKYMIAREMGNCTPCESPDCAFYVGKSS